jgi:hypothetical protein
LNERSNLGGEIATSIDGVVGVAPSGKVKLSEPVEPVSMPEVEKVRTPL